MSIHKTFLKALKPYRLISLVMTYLLGAGLVQYIRQLRSWPDLILGAVFIVLVALSLELLKLLREFINPKNWPEEVTLNDVRQMRLIIGLVTATLVTVAISILIGWMLADVIWQGLLLLMLALAFLGGGYYYANFTEKLRPYQLLLEVFIFVVLPPAFAFFLQSEDHHQFLTLVVICLVPAYLAYRILIQLKYFGRDHKLGVRTFVMRVGWSNAMTFHNAFILLTYLLFALITFFGFPWFLLWPVFLTLPIGLLEIWLVERARRGGNPLWRIMQFATASVMLLPIYMVGFNFWIR